MGVGGARPLRNVLGEALRGRFSFEARNYLFSFPSYVHFEEFLFPALLQNLAPNVALARGFWFLRCLGALFDNCAPSLGIFLRTPTTTTSIFWKFLFFFQAELVLLAWQLWWSPGWAKLFGGGSSKKRMETWFPALARSSAEGPSIVVAFSTSRLRWSMVQERQKPDEVSLWVPFIVYKNQRENQRVLRSLFPRPNVSTVLLFAVFL